MATVQEILQQIPARGIRVMLEEFYQVRRRAEDGGKSSVPMVTLHLKSGRDMRGWVLALEEESWERGNALLLQLADDGGSPGDDVTYLSMDTVEAMTVHKAAEAAAVLSFGEQGGSSPQAQP